MNCIRHKGITLHQIRFVCRTFAIAFTFDTDNIYVMETLTDPPVVSYMEALSVS